MYTLRFTGEFKRQMKLCERRGYDMELLREAIRILSVESNSPVVLNCNNIKLLLKF